MILLDLTLPTPEENLALEEALLYWAEDHETECLRLWESPTHFVVLGAGSPARTDVRGEACRQLNIPMLRRCSGGGTVLQGPGCLNYTLVLDADKQAELKSITGTNSFVLGRIATALSRCGLPDATMRGYSDLTTGDLKFSGNAQRRRKRHVLFHGTILYNMDLDLVSRLLDTPEKMPDYRENREHLGFIRNVPVDPACARREIANEWGAANDMPNEESRTDLMNRVKDMASKRYRDQEWIFSI